MPRSSLVPKYCLHKPSGRAYVRIHGKVIYTGDYGTAESKQEYGRLIAELAVNPLPRPKIPGKITITEVCDVYWEHAQRYYCKNGKPSGWLAHIRLMLRKLRKTYGMTTAADFGPLKLKAIRQTLINAGHSRPYINKLVPIIPRMFKWAVAEEIVPASIYQALRTIEGLRKGRTEAHETKPVLPVEEAVVEATLPHLSPVVAAMVRFQRFTGARPGEVCQLRPCDVDRSGGVWTYRPETHKTEHHGRERTIFIGPQAQDVIRPYLLRDAHAHCFSPAESEIQRHIEQRERRRTRVQPSQRNRRKAKAKRLPRMFYTKDSYRRAVARAIEKANRLRTEEATDMGIEPMLLPHWHPNQLRHSAATEIRRQYGLEAAQVLLGHAKASTTEIYAERDARLAVEVAKKIG